MTTVNERLKTLRKVMEEQKVEAVVIPSSDFHDTEYVCDHFQARAWFSGFTGSAGTLVVLQEGGALWTDGRYFIQAVSQLKGSGLTLMKMGEPETPTIPEYLIDHLQSGDVVGFDGRCVSYSQYEEYAQELAAHDIHLKVDQDLPGMAWNSRPELPATETFLYEEKYSGKSVKDKLCQVRQAMKDARAQYHILSKVDEIAWLFNLRAHDIPNFPVALAYALIGEEDGVLYINKDRLDSKSLEQLSANNIQVKDYEAVYEDVKDLEAPVLMQKSFINSKIGSSAAKPVWRDDPVVLLKARKNPVEMEGARQAHIKDGAAVVQWWHWLEKAMDSQEPVTEISAAQKLQEFRAQQPLYLEDSFETIPAYGANAAMPHYHAQEDNPVLLEKKGLFLVDSGGQYLDGTTDITRTYVMGDLSEKERHAFTRVLQGHIALASAKFLYGVRGLNLDILARGPLWDEFFDYNHGTGHGVGALSNVHEAPNGFRWKIVPERNDSCVLEEGMITSNEPGWYVENEFGIRHENLMLARKSKSNEFGQFMEHETLTMVPFDVRGLDLSIMTQKEKDWLNGYHKKVFETLKPLLNEEDVNWLEEKTQPVK